MVVEKTPAFACTLTVPVVQAKGVRIAVRVRCVPNSVFVSMTVRVLRFSAIRCPEIPFMKNQSLVPDQTPGIPASV